MSRAAADGSGGGRRGVFIGRLRRDGDWRNATNSLVWLTAGAGAAFILLVNAFHGSLRDIAFEIELRSADDANLAGVSRDPGRDGSHLDCHVGLCRRLAGRAHRAIACSDRAARFAGRSKSAPDHGRGNCCARQCCPVCPASQSSQACLGCGDARPRHHSGAAGHARLCAPARPIKSGNPLPRVFCPNPADRPLLVQSYSRLQGWISSDVGGGRANAVTRTRPHARTFRSRP